MDKLDRKIQFKKFTASNRGIGFFLTKEQIQQLLDEAKIDITDWRHQGYHLARRNDEGDYSWGNCRFITASQNWQEKKPISYWLGKKRKEEVKNKMRASHIGNKIAIGRIWIYNLQLQKTKMIKPIELQDYLDASWAKGRKIKY